MDNWWSGMVDGFNSKKGANALIGLGSGLLSQPTFAKGLAAGGQGFMQGAELDQQYADAEAEKLKLDTQGNVTRSWLEQQGYTDLVPLVDAGQAGLAYTEALKRKQPGYGQTAATADWAKLNDGTLFNQRTGETMPLEGMEGGEGGFVAPQELFGREKDLAAQYAGQDPVKTYQAVRNGYERVRTSAEIANSNKEGSGAADISLVFAYMKMLDPTSVVREGEFAAAANAGGVPDQIMNTYNRLIQGDKLDPSVRQQFVQQADAIYADVSQNLSGLNEQYTTRAQGWGVDPANFLATPEQYEPLSGGGVRMPNGNTVRPL